MERNIVFLAPGDQYEIRSRNGKTLKVLEHRGSNVAGRLQPVIQDSSPIYDKDGRQGFELSADDIDKRRVVARVEADGSEAA